MANTQEDNKEIKSSGGQIHKKRGIVRRILKCIGLTLLTILLILSLVFQTPWKVIMLLTIIFLACTILPKHLRKWFWFSAAAIVVILIIWVFLPDDEGWRRYEYNFDKELAAMEAGRGIPDEQNAATIYNLLMERYDANDYYIFDLVDSHSYTFDKIFRNPWRSEDFPEITDRLKHIQGAIETLIEISKIKQCIFPLNDPANPESQSDRNSAVRRWARLLVIAINNDIAESRINEALQKNVALLQMAKHLFQQPTTIDLSTGLAVESLAIRQFNRFIVTDKAAETHISFIEKALQDVKHDWCSDLTRILEYDKLCTKAQFANYYEIKPKGKIRLRRDPLKEIRATLREDMQNLKFDNDQLKAYYERIAYPSYLQKKLIKSYTILNWFYMPSNPQKAASIIDADYQKYYIMEDSDWQWQEESRKISITEALFYYLRYLTEYWVHVPNDSFSNIHYLHLRLSSDLRGSQIIIALRRYKNKTGNWPEGLDEIKTLADPNVFIDPINRGSFVYKLTEENFILYSKGKNNIDEDGKRDTFGEDTGADDWLIWPLKLSKTDEEKADVKSD